MLQGILSTLIKLPFSIKTFVLSILSGRLRQASLYCGYLLAMSHLNEMLPMSTTTLVFMEKEDEAIFNCLCDALLHPYQFFSHFGMFSWVGRFSQVEPVLHNEYEP